MNIIATPLLPVLLAMTLFPAADTVRAGEQGPATEQRRSGYGVFSAQQRADVDVREAARRLAQVQRERSRGVEALRSERAPNVDAQLALHRYWIRQEKLRLAVEVAQRRYHETLRAQRNFGLASN